MKFAPLLAIAGLALIGLEVWRLSTPAVVRLHEVWAFDTPTGLRQVGGVIEVEQDPAIPWLPGGAVGRQVWTGDTAPFSVGGHTFLTGKGHQWLLEMGLKHGTATPHWTGPMEGPDSTGYTFGFYRRLAANRSIVVLSVANWPGSLRQLIDFGIRDPQKALPDRMSLPELEAANPGIRLKRVTISVTDAPVTQGQTAVPL